MNFIYNIFKNLDFYIVFLIVFIHIQMLWWLYFFLNFQNQYFDLLKKNEVLVLKILNREQLNEISDIVYFDQKEQKYKIREEVEIEKSQTKRKNQIMLISEAIFFLLVFNIISLMILKFYHRKNQLLMEKIIFLNSFTHELKTPIAAIKLNLQTLLKKVNKKYLYLLESSINQLDILNHKINQILFDKDIHLPSSNQFFSINLEKVLNTILSELEYEIKRKNFKIKIQNELMEIDKLNLKIPAQWLSLILKELLINSIKYSGNKIIIQISEEKKWFLKLLKISIRDFKSSSEHYLKTQSTGLGLYYIQEILKKCKGKMIIEHFEQYSIVSIFIIKK